MKNLMVIDLFEHNLLEHSHRLGKLIIKSILKISHTGTEQSQYGYLSRLVIIVGFVK